MRATSPLDALAPASSEMPLPKYSIGTKLDLTQVASYNVDYYKKKVRMTLIRGLRKTLTSLQRQGYLKDMKGKKMLDVHKQELRKMFDFMATADTVEVAGFAPHGMHVSGTIAHECYLAGGFGYSGVSYNYYLLFRKVDEQGRHLVFLYPEPLLCESEMRNCAVL